jgi:hypothetical protein
MDSVEIIDSFNSVISAFAFYLMDTSILLEFPWSAAVVSEAAALVPAAKQALLHRPSVATAKLDLF